MIRAWLATVAAAGLAEALAYFLSLAWGFAALIVAFVFVAIRVSSAMASTGAKAYATEARVNAILPVLGAHAAAISTAQSAANNAQSTANNANSTANNAQGAINTLNGGTTGAANNGGETSGPQNYGETSQANGNVAVFVTGGQVGGAAAHYHNLPSLPGDLHTHTVNDSHIHAMAHGHPVT